MATVKRETQFHLSHFTQSIGVAIILIIHMLVWMLNLKILCSNLTCHAWANNVSHQTDQMTTMPGIIDVIMQFKWMTLFAQAWYIKLKQTKI